MQEPTYSPENPPKDEDVHWFGESHRRIGGLPDTRYGWLENNDQVFIVKAMATDLTAYAETLLAHERKMLGHLQRIGAPVPSLLDVGRPDWLVTRFGGLSLQRLAHPGGFQGLAPLDHFGFTERLAAWVYLLPRLQTMADKGVLVIDLYSANVVLPLTDGTKGQLRLQEAALIDHAHTVEAGMDMRRPVWINHNMERIAPELRSIMQRDMDKMTAAFAHANASLPVYSRLPAEQDAHSRKVWAEYNVDQELQNRIGANQLSCDRAMQFAAGHALQALLPLAHESRQGLNTVLQRMMAMEPNDRYPSLFDAAKALKAVVTIDLPFVSQHHYTKLTPDDLKLPSDAEVPVPEPDEGETVLVGGGLPTSIPSPFPEGNTFMPDAVVTQHAHLERWLYAAVALGAVCGALWPLPWLG